MVCLQPLKSTKTLPNLTVEQCLVDSRVPHWAAVFMASIPYEDLLNLLLAAVTFRVDVLLELTAATMAIYIVQVNLVLGPEDAVTVDEDERLCSENDHLWNVDHECFVVSKQAFVENNKRLLSFEHFRGFKVEESRLMSEAE